MSAVHALHWRMVAVLSKNDRLSRDIIGAAVLSLPSRTSPSAYPRTINHALALGNPSGFFDYLKNIRKFKILAGFASKIQIPFSRNHCSSFTLAFMKRSFSCTDKYRSLMSGFRLAKIFCCRVTFLADRLTYIPYSFLVAPFSWETATPIQASFGDGMKVLAVIGYDLDQIIRQLLHCHPHRVQFVHRDWAISFIFG